MQSLCRVFHFRCHQWPNDHVVDPGGHDDGKSIIATVFPPIYRILCIVSLGLKPGLLPHTFDVFYFPYVTAVQARWRHPHIPLMRSSHARFSGSAGEALSSSSLCHCWHLQSFCYCVGVGFVGGLLQCHPSKPRVTNLPQLRILRSLCKAGFGMDLRTNCMVHGYKEQLIPVKWMASEKAQLLVDICISYDSHDSRHVNLLCLMSFPSL